MDDDIIDVDSPEQRTAMRRRHVELGRRMQAVAVAALEELEAKIAAGQPLGLSREDAGALLDVGRRLEREALGEREQAADAPIVGMSTASLLCTWRSTRDWTPSATTRIIWRCRTGLTCHID
jgi:hypothetical protein